MKSGITARIASMKDDRLTGIPAELKVLQSFDGDPATPLMMEEFLVRRAAADGPTLMLYGWNRPVLVIGYGQDPTSVDLAACSRLGVPVVRRITGGTGVLHGEDIAATLALPPDHPWTKTIHGLYERFLATIQIALGGLGVPLERSVRSPGPRGTRSPICFEDDWGETLRTAGRKSIGCAQARRQGGVLIHGVILRGVDATLQAAVYGTDPARISNALGSIAPMPPTRSAIAIALTDALSAAIGLPIARIDLPAIPDDLISRYSGARWAPVR